MSALTAIARFLGAFFAEVLPQLLAEWRKPRKTTRLGSDDSKEAVDVAIRERLGKIVESDDQAAASDGVNDGNDRGADRANR